MLGQLQPALYTRNTGVFFLDGPVNTARNKQRRYVLAVRDLPAEDKPREKLSSRGPSMLSLAELLAVILNTGTKKEEVLAMCSRILKEYGPKSVLTQKDAKKLAAELNIPLGKALQIVACGELGRRTFAKNGAAVPTIRTANEVFEYAVDMRNFTKEQLRGLYLNSRYKLIHDEVLSVGTMDASIIHPRDVFKPALEYGAAAVILVHNHPSGEINPSPSDITITEQIIKAGRIIGVELIDHIIITKDSYSSIPANYTGE
jgi:DNA repair protein RadC